MSKEYKVWLTRTIHEYDVDYESSYKISTDLKSTPVILNQEQFDDLINGIKWKYQKDYVIFYRVTDDGEETENSAVFDFIKYAQEYRAKVKADQEKRQLAQKKKAQTLEEKKLTKEKELFEKLKAKFGEQGEQD